MGVLVKVKTQNHYLSIMDEIEKCEIMTCFDIGVDFTYLL